MSATGASETVEESSIPTSRHVIYCGGALYEFQ